MYNVFTRTWWKEADPAEWPGGLEPEAGKKTYLARGIEENAAIMMCREWNQTHKPGRYSKKAEYETS